MENISARTLDLAIRIQQIPAPTFNEGRRAHFLRDLFVQEGLQDITEDALHNVYARLPGDSGSQTSAPLVVSAHTDTVFPPDTNLAIRYEDGKIFGPGLGDNSMGVAGLFGLLWHLREEKTTLPGDVWLVANVCEEGLGDLKGIREVVARFGATPRAYIVLEGMAFGQAYHRALGVRRYRVIAETNGGHSWANFGEPSAIHELARLVTQITGIQAPKGPRLSYNVGIITGGTSVNTIAQRAEMELDMRSEDPGTLERLVAQVDGYIQQANYPGVKVHQTLIGSRPAGEIPAEHPLVRLAAHCIEEQGMTPKLTIGSTDANIPLSLGLPAVCIGLTQGGGAHTTEEYITSELLEQGLSQLVALVEGAFAL